MSGTRDRGNILGTMPVDRLVLTMSAPIMVSMLVSAVYNLVDSIYVAQVSDLDFLALSYAYPVQLMMVAFCTGIGVGFNATFAQRLGEGKGEEANRVACHGFLFYTLCWLLFLAFALFGAPLFFRLSTGDPVVARAGVEYLTICCGASIGMCMQFLTERLLQTTGHPAGFMIVQGSGAVLNIVLDPVFIFGLDMGVAGAAVATVIGQISGACIGFLLLWRIRREFSVSFRGFRTGAGVFVRMAFPQAFPDHFPTEKSQQGEGDPVVETFDQAFEMFPGDPSDNRHGGLKGGQCQGDLQGTSHREAFHGYSARYRGRKTVHRQSEGQQEEFYSSHGVRWFVFFVCGSLVRLGGGCKSTNKNCVYLQKFFPFLWKTGQSGTGMRENVPNEGGTGREGGREEREGRG